MSNQSIAKRISEVVVAYEREEVSASAVAESIELHKPALEGIPRSLRDALHKLSVELINQDLSPLEQEMLGLAPTREALESLKALLRSIS